MAENKTQRTKASVSEFLAKIPDAGRRKDAKVVAALIRKATGERPAMWGPSIVGYGDTTYTGSGGREVPWFYVGFSPRKGALVLYLMGGLTAFGALLDDLGPHKVGGGCLYLPRLEGVNTAVLTRLIKQSHQRNRKPRNRVAKPKPAKRSR